MNWQRAKCRKKKLASYAQTFNKQDLQIFPFPCFKHQGIDTILLEHNLYIIHHYPNPFEKNDFSLHVSFLELRNLDVPS